jgi:thioredoxin reductase (NADPH)
MVRDLAIIGTGPAGLSAGLLAGRYGLDTVLFEREELGGGLVNRHTVEAYPGFPGGVSGPELRSDIVTQLREYDLDLRVAEVTSLDFDDELRVRTGDEAFASKTVVLATGTRPEPLSCPGADRYEGRGIFDCALCDGPLYADTRLGVVGNGEAAVMDSVFLSEHASEVVLVVPDPELSASQYACGQVAAADNVTIRYRTEIAAVLGDEVVTGLKLKETDSGREYIENVEGLLVQTNPIPNTACIPENVALTDDGAVAVDTRLSTNVPGVFAAGAVREDAVQWTMSAVGDGARAFESARQYLDA